MTTDDPVDRQVPTETPAFPARDPIGISLLSHQPVLAHAVQPEEAVFLALEQSDTFSWSEQYEAAGLGDRLVGSGFLGSSVGRPAWIFDHAPKTGGTEFSAIVNRRLDSHDHLLVRWPNSWFGVLLGRLERAVIVHGHGARYAAELAPWRDWQRAVCVREPSEMVASTYQQQARWRDTQGLESVSFVTWLEKWFDRPDSSLLFNQQVRWLAQRRVPSSQQPEGAVCPPGDLDAMTADACRELDACAVVGSPRSVSAMFDLIVRAAGLRIRPEVDGVPIANSSEHSSRALVDGLPDDMRDALQVITGHDRTLADHAMHHRGWLS